MCNMNRLAACILGCLLVVAGCSRSDNAELTKAKAEAAAARAEADVANAELVKLKATLAQVGAAKPDPKQGVTGKATQQRNPDEGVPVAEIEQLLQELGYNLPPNGVMMTATDGSTGKATREFSRLCKNVKNNTSVTYTHNPDDRSQYSFRSGDFAGDDPASREAFIALVTKISPALGAAAKGAQGEFDETRESVEKIVGKFQLKANSKHLELSAASPSSTAAPKGKADKVPAKSVPDDPTPGKVYKSPTELFADMPKDAYPKFGLDGGIEQAAARKWMKKNLVGRTVEWTATIKEIAITGDGPFTVRLWYTGFKDPSEIHATFHPELPEGGLLVGFSFGGPFTLGGENCEVILGGKGIVGLSGLHVGYAECTADEAAMLRKFKGTKVSLRSKVLGSYVSNGKIACAGEYKDRVPLGLEVSLPSVNGILPQSRKAAEPQ